uniref:Uncharacterized protein n=1 Tax=Mustela putorius furo TaxID=9669 RepID=M3Z8X9_MUSPF
MPRLLAPCPLPDRSSAPPGPAQFFPEAKEHGQSKWCMGLSRAFPARTNSPALSVLSSEAGWEADPPHGGACQHPPVSTDGGGAGPAAGPTPNRPKGQGLTSVLDAGIPPKKHSPGKATANARPEAEHKRVGLKSTGSPRSSGTRRGARPREGGQTGQCYSAGHRLLLTAPGARKRSLGKPSERRAWGLGGGALAWSRPDAGSSRRPPRPGHRRDRLSRKRGGRRDARLQVPARGGGGAGLGEPRARGLAVPREGSKEPPATRPRAGVGTRQPVAPAPHPVPHVCHWLLYLAATDHPDLPPSCSLFLRRPLRAGDAPSGEVSCLRVTYCGPSHALRAPRAPRDTAGAHSWGEGSSPESAPLAPLAGLGLRLRRRR